MNLIYIEEVGDTGVKLNNSHTPKFGLVAALIHKRNWVQLERKLIDITLETQGDLRDGTNELG